MGELTLTSWGKVHVIKMVVSPQFNYVLMMLPVTLSPQIFKQYDTIIQDFLWEGKNPGLNSVECVLLRTEEVYKIPNYVFCEIFVLRNGQNSPTLT